VIVPVGNGELVTRGYNLDILDPFRTVDHQIEIILRTGHAVGRAAANEIILGRIGREQQVHPAAAIDGINRDKGVAVGTEIQYNIIALVKLVVAVIGPDLDIEIPVHPDSVTDPVTVVIMIISRYIILGRSRQRPRDNQYCHQRHNVHNFA